MPDMIKNVIVDLTAQIGWIEGNDYHKFPGWQNVTDAMREAVALLKEQEPKQVLSIVDSVGEMEVGYCPSCRRGIANKKSDPTKFCRFCGQAVKWDEI